MELNGKSLGVIFDQHLLLLTRLQITVTFQGSFWHVETSFELRHLIGPKRDPNLMLNGKFFQPFSLLGSFLSKANSF